MAQQRPRVDVIETTRRFYEHVWDPDVPLSGFAPDVVLEVQSLAATFEGVAAIRGFLADWRSGYAEFEMQPDEITDLGNGVVFAAVRLIGRPRGGASTLERRRPFAYVWADGQVVKIIAFSSDVEQARTAAQQMASGPGIGSQAGAPPALRSGC